MVRSSVEPSGSSSTPWDPCWPRDRVSCTGRPTVLAAFSTARRTRAEVDEGLRASYGVLVFQKVPSRVVVVRAPGLLRSRRRDPGESRRVRPRERWTLVVVVCDGRLVRLCSSDRPSRPRATSGFRAFRPREHGAGGLEHRTRAPARGARTIDGRAGRRGSRSTSTRSSPCWPRCGSSLPSPLTLAGVQIVACALGALPVFWLARRHLGVGEARGVARARVPRVPMARLERAQRDAPRDARHPTLPLRDLVPRRRPARPLRRVRCLSPHCAASSSA